MSDWRISKLHHLLDDAVEVLRHVGQELEELEAQLEAQPEPEPEEPEFVPAADAEKAEALHLLNLARAARGLAPVPGFVRGKRLSAGDCPFARTLNYGVEEAERLGFGATHLFHPFGVPVGARGGRHPHVQLTPQHADEAQRIASVWEVEKVGPKVRIPEPLRQLIGKFDRGFLPELRER